jgi:hypothetical protein
MTFYSLVFVLHLWIDQIMLFAGENMLSFEAFRQPKMAGNRAIVVFCDTTEIRWLRCLKRGFRHCAVVLEVEDGWILCDSLSNKTFIKQIFNMNSEALVQRFLAAGLHAVEVDVRTPPRRLAPPLPYSCVEGVKRILGIHAWTILTPWQLYKHLVREPKIRY